MKTEPDRMEVVDDAVAVALREMGPAKRLELVFQSEKHIRDIAGILRVSGDSLDFPYIESWSTRKELTEIWWYTLPVERGSSTCLPETRG